MALVRDIRCHGSIAKATECSEEAPVMVKMRWCAVVLTGLLSSLLVALGGCCAVGFGVYRLGLPPWRLCVLLVPFVSLVGAGIGWFCGLVSPLPSPARFSKAWWIAGAVLGLVNGGYGAVLRLILVVG